MALFPFTQVQGAPVAVNYGGFTPGQKITFKVVSVTSTQGPTGVFPTKKAPVPAGLPAFTKGQSVTFTIGTRGQLTGPAFSINYLSDTGAANIYYREALSPIAGTPNTKSATVYKTSANKPTSVSLTFQKYRLNGTQGLQNFLEYELQ